VGFLAAKRKGASIVFVNSKRRVLLYLRDNKPGIPYPGCWDLLGGGAEPGESPEDCIKREVLEEIEFDLKGPRLFNVYEMEDRVEHTYWISHDLDIATTPLHEGQKLRWFSQQELTALPEGEVGFGFKPILLDFFRRQPWMNIANE
jgi:8-oxo-dGTP diphosphatase